MSALIPELPPTYFSYTSWLGIWQQKADREVFVACVAVERDRVRVSRLRSGILVGMEHWGAAGMQLGR